MDNFKRKKEAKKEKYYSSNNSSILRILIVNKSKGWSFSRGRQDQRIERQQQTNGVECKVTSCLRSCCWSWRPRENTNNGENKT